MKHKAFIEQVKKEFDKVLTPSDVHVQAGENAYSDILKVRERGHNFLEQKLTQAIENYREEVRVERKNQEDHGNINDIGWGRIRGMNQVLQEVARKDKEYFL